MARRKNRPGKDVDTTKPAEASTEHDETAGADTATEGESTETTGSDSTDSASADTALSADKPSYDGAKDAASDDDESTDAGETDSTSDSDDEPDSADDATSDTDDTDTDTDADEGSDDDADSESDDDDDDDSDEEEAEEARPERDEEAEKLWASVGIDPVEISFAAGTGYTLRHYRTVTDEDGDEAEEALFLATDGKVHLFRTAEGLIDFINDPENIPVELPAPTAKKDDSTSSDDSDADNSDDKDDETDEDDDTAGEESNSEDTDDKDGDKDSDTDTDVASADEDDKPTKPTLSKDDADESDDKDSDDDESDDTDDDSDEDDEDEDEDQDDEDEDDEDEDLGEEVEQVKGAHDLAVIPDYAVLVEKLRARDLIPDDEDVYELDLVVENLRGGRDAWDRDLLIGAGEVARDLAFACQLRDVLSALAAGSPLDDLDEALRSRGLFARMKLRKISPERAAVAWRGLISKLAARIEWHD